MPNKYLKFILRLLTAPIWLFVVVLGTIAEYLEKDQTTLKQAWQSSWKIITKD